MLNDIPDLPPGVIGFEVSGKLETEDYETSSFRRCKRPPQKGKCES